MKNIIKNQFIEHITISNSLNTLINEVEAAAKLCIKTLKNGGKILIFGNGGSAADAQHIAAELVGRYKVERKGLPAIALNTDVSTLTAIGNDFGYEYIFERQVAALANKGDVIIGISTSGNSLNVIKALKIASELDCKTIAFSGGNRGGVSEVSDVTIAVSSTDTPRIQEMHIVIGHTICHLIDIEFQV